MELPIAEKETTHLPLMESFYTIQGEGFYQGHAAYFIRLGGCDVKCVWCDVKDSWDVNAHPQTSIEEMVSRAKKSGTKIVVITGGEPAMHDLTNLTSDLRSAGLKTHIETSGAYELTGTWDWICFSPKKFMAPHPSVSQQANELKVVVYNKTDFEWAEEFAAKVNPDCELYLQPEWSRVKEMSALIVDYVKANPQWKISIQAHKYIDVP